MKRRDELENLRDEINKVTIEILTLCAERFTLARKIGEMKAKMDLPIEDLKVEENLKHKVLEKCRFLGVDPEFGLKLLNLLLDESKKAQRKLIEQGKTDK